MTQSTTELLQAIKDMVAYECEAETVGQVVLDHSDTIIAALELNEVQRGPENGVNCPSCGCRLPSDYGAKVCPDCGEAPMSIKEYEAMKGQTNVVS